MSCLHSMGMAHLLKIYRIKVLKSLKFYGIIRKTKTNVFVRKTVTHDIKIE